MAADAALALVLLLLLAFIAWRERQSGRSFQLAAAEHRARIDTPLVGEAWIANFAPAECDNGWGERALFICRLKPSAQVSTSSRGLNGIADIVFDG